MQRKCKLYVMEKDKIIMHDDGTKEVVTEAITGIRPVKGFDIISEKPVLITVPDNEFYRLALSVGSIEDITEEEK